jgi:hypothetical protein
LEDAYGIREEESLLGKANRYLWKVVLFIVFVLLACILIPILIFVIIYQMCFNQKMKIVVPNFLKRYLK